MQRGCQLRQEAGDNAEQIGVPTRGDSYRGHHTYLALPGVSRIAMFFRCILSRHTIRYPLLRNPRDRPEDPDSILAIHPQSGEGPGRFEIPSLTEKASEQSIPGRHS